MEETVRMVQSAAQAGVEISAEVLKIIGPALAKGAMKLLGAGGKLLGYGIEKGIGKIADAVSAGTVTREHLFAASAKANCAVLTTDSFPSEAVERMVEMAKERNIPVSVNGKGENRSISFLESDKEAMAQILQEWQKERLAPRADRQGITAFVVNDKRNLDIIKSEFENNGIECWFTQNAKGEVLCNFKSEDLENARRVSENFKKAQGEIADNFSISPNVPETERMTEIQTQIEQFENAVPTAEDYERILEDMKESGVTFPGYSDRNMELIKREMPDAKQVAGKAFWEQQGLTINENAKGVDVFAPQMDDNGDPVLDENGKQTFTTVTVYDISQTNAFESEAQMRVNELRNEYNAEKFKAFSEAENKSVTVTNENNGKSVEITIDDKLRKSDVEEMLLENLGYSTVQAELAANKLGAELGLSDDFYADHIQSANIERVLVNIRYKSDDVSLQDISFSAVKAMDENVMLNVENNGKTVLIAPAELSENELKEIFKEQLGMSDIQAEKAIDKSRKIDRQINAKLQETVYSHDESHTVNIERTSVDAFTVKDGEKIKSYTFSQVNLEERISEDFGIPKENAHNVIKKANNQSVVQNKIQRSADEKRKAQKLKKDSFAQSKDASTRKVKR